MLHFHSTYNSWKRQKISTFLTFLGGIEVEHWRKMGQENENVFAWVFTWIWSKPYDTQYDF